MTMKLAASAATLFFLVGSMTPVYAQGEQHEKEQAKGKEHQEQAKKPAVRPQQAYGGSYHGGVKADDTTHGGVHHSGVPQHAGQVRSGFTQSRAQSWSSEHRS